MRIMTNVINMRRSLVVQRDTLRGSWLEYGTVTALLFTIACALTDWVLFDANSKLFTSGIGDATSGFLWLIYADSDLNPAFAHTNLINYPYGQNLSNPIFITWILVFGPLWLLSRIFSPTAALYLITVGGLVSCGLIMYALIKRLTGNMYVAFFAAYAAAFVPYHMLKAGAHLTNVYAWVFIAIIGSSIAFWRNPTWRRGILVAISFAAAMYTDGYYIFIAGVLGVALLISLIATDLLTGVPRKAIGRKLLRLVSVAAILLVLLLPLAVVQLSASSDIQQGLSNSREDIKREIATYTVEPINFLLPAEGNVLVSDFDWFQRLFLVKNLKSNNSENTNYIGYLILVLCIVGFYYALRGLTQARRTGEPLAIQNYVLIVSIIAVPLTFMWMVPPTLYGIKMPINYLTDYIAYWRVPARIFLALHPLLIIIAVLTLVRLMERFVQRATWRIAIILIAIILIALEYSTTANTPTFGYANMPQTYTWLAGQEDVDAIAEVPMVDRPVEVTGYYVFAQMIHNKPLVNNQLSKLAPGQYNALADPSNPETINFWRARSVDMVIIHDNRCAPESWGELIRSEINTLSPPFMDGTGYYTCTYKLDKGKPADGYYPYADKGFQKINYRDADVNYWLVVDDHQPVIRTITDKGELVTVSDRAKFSADLTFIGTAPMKQLNWSVRQNGREVATGSGMQKTLIEADIDPSQPVQLSLTTDSFFRVPVSGELIMDNVQIIKQ